MESTRLIAVKLCAWSLSAYPCTYIASCLSSPTWHPFSFLIENEWLFICYGSYIVLAYLCCGPQPVTLRSTHTFLTRRRAWKQDSIGATFATVQTIDINEKIPWNLQHYCTIAIVVSYPLRLLTYYVDRNVRGCHITLFEWHLTAYACSDICIVELRYRV